MYLGPPSAAFPMWFTRKKTIVVHSEEFHADDVFAVATLELIFGEENLRIIRTRDESVIAKADIVADVGGVYDPTKNRFDHHQTGGAGERPNKIPYASFGLVWKQYGAHQDVAGSQEVADIVDGRLVQPIDAIDTGTPIMSELFKDVRLYDISTLISTLNPIWNEDKESVDERFMDAVHLAKKIILREIEIARSNLLGAQFVFDTYNKAEDKRVIIFDKEYPWWRPFKDLPEPLFVVYPKAGKWRVRAVPTYTGMFENRKNFPTAWAGKRNAELSAITGVPGSVFCHNKLFLVVADTRKGALALVKKALEA